MGTTVSITHGKLLENLDIILAFQVENRFLSNFWPCNIILVAETINGIEFPEMKFNTVENAYQAWKCGSLEQRHHMMALSAGDAKDFSRLDDFQTREDLTDDLRVQAMGVFLKQKFSDKNPELKNKLIETKNTLLIEGNNWNDTFFGFCLETGQGQNHLGQLIMKIRNDLKS